MNKNILQNFLINLEIEAKCFDFCDENWLDASSLTHFLEKAGKCL
jgi:hypothetical protein